MITPPNPSYNAIDAGIGYLLTRSDLEWEHWRTTQGLSPSQYVNVVRALQNLAVCHRPNQVSNSHAALAAQALALLSQSESAANFAQKTFSEKQTPAFRRTFSPSHQWHEPNLRWLDQENQTR